MRKKKSKTNEKRDKLDNLRARGGRTNGRARVRTAQTVMVVVVMTIMIIIMVMMIKRKKKRKKRIAVQRDHAVLCDALTLCD